MAYVPVPKDLNAVKTKVLLNLTKRQLICFGAGAALGVPLFFLLKAHTGVSTAAICMSDRLYLAVHLSVIARAPSYHSLLR